MTLSLIVSSSLFSVGKDGDVCISILHEPGEDKFGYEKPEERWLPIHTVETILLSVISMIADPNDESPANVDAAVSIIPVLMLLSILQFRNTHPLSKMLFYVFHIQQSKVGIA